MRFLSSILLTLSLFTGFIHASGDKKPTISVSFYVEGEIESGKKHVFPLQSDGFTNYYQRVPEITTKDVRAFTPFPAEDQISYGIVLQLTPQGARRLQNLSNANQGRILLAMINGRPVDTVWINRQVNDGLIVIWKGVSVGDIRLADMNMPRIGQDPKAWKKEIKDKQKGR